MKLLPKSFYLNDDVVSISRNLLGKVLVTTVNNVKIKSRIVETEAYRGPEDRASHSYKNRFTERTKVMYEEGGVAYIYISYGQHFMLNVVTAPESTPHAVLIRAVEPLTELDLLKKRRKVINDNYILSGGPGKVCQALLIDKQHNSVKLYSRSSEISIWEDEFVVEKVVTSPRVGMSIHVGEASHLPWRFYIHQNKYVSRPLQPKYNW